MGLHLHSGLADSRQQPLHTILTRPIHHHHQQTAGDSDVLHEKDGLQAPDFHGVIPERMDDEGHRNPVQQDQEGTEGGLVTDQDQSTAQDQQDDGTRQKEIGPPLHAVGGHRLFRLMKIGDAVVCLEDKDRREAEPGH